MDQSTGSENAANTASASEAPSPSAPEAPSTEGLSPNRSPRPLGEPPPIPPSEQAIQKRAECGRAKVAARQDAIAQAARENIAAQLRKAQGIEDPGPRRERKPSGGEPGPSASVKAPEESAKKADPPANPVITEQSMRELMEKLSAQANDRAQKELESARAEAKAEKERAQALIELARRNQVKFLEENNLSVDDFTARLRNGGTETPEQAYQRQLDERHAALERRIANFEQQRAQDAQARSQAQAIAALEAPLKEDFPFVNALLTPKGAYEHLAREKAAAKGGDIDYAASLASLEKQLHDQQLALLQNPSIAAKLPYREATQPNAQTAESPRTLTNRVTSSHSPVSARVPIPGTREDLLAKRARAMELVRAAQG